MASRKKNPSDESLPVHMTPEVIAHAQAVVDANPRGAPEVIKTPEAAPVEPPCALEGMPVGSKVVVGPGADGVRQARLTISASNEVIVLPADDLANTLPTGAKIRKRDVSLFEATMLNPTKPYQPLIASSARNAITQFRAHFA